MRVTKLIKEYVEKQVSALPQFAEESPEEKLYKEMRHKVEEFGESLENEIKSLMEKKIQQFKTEQNIPDDMKITVYDYNIYRTCFHRSQLCENAEKAKEARLKARREAIENILLNLELGAGRAELEDMLKALA